MELAIRTRDKELEEKIGVSSQVSHRSKIVGVPLKKISTISHMCDVNNID